MSISSLLSGSPILQDISADVLQINTINGDILNTNSLITDSRISTNKTNLEIKTNSSYFRQSNPSLIGGLIPINTFNSLIGIGVGKRNLNINDITNKIYKHVICGFFKISSILTTPTFRILLNTNILKTFSIAPISDYLINTSFKIEIYASSTGLEDVNQLPLYNHITLTINNLTPQSSMINSSLVALTTDEFIIYPQLSFSTSSVNNSSITYLSLINEQ